MRVQLPDQGHTLACLLRAALFEQGATEAACVVLHPQDTHLTIDIKTPSDDAHAVLRKAILAVRADVKELRKCVQAHESFLK
jgi:DNA-directed RNA polymerase subunit L